MVAVPECRFSTTKKCAFEITWLIIGVSPRRGAETAICFFPHITVGIEAIGKERPHYTRGSY